MKVIVLGLDALNHELIEKHPKEMPALYRHLNEDTQGRLKTTVPYYTGPTWTSFQTGKKVGNHGIINFLKYDADFNLKLLSGLDIKEKTFYEAADEMNLKCFIMNLPYTHPPKIKGDVIFSWLHVYDKIEELTKKIQALKDRIGSISGQKIREVIVSVGGSHIYCVPCLDTMRK